MDGKKSSVGRNLEQTPTFGGRPSVLTGWGGRKIPPKERARSKNEKINKLNDYLRQSFTQVLLFDLQIKIHHTL